MTAPCPYPPAIRLCSILQGARRPKLEIEVRDYATGEALMIEEFNRVAALIAEYGYRWAGRDGVWVRGS